MQKRNKQFFSIIIPVYKESSTINKTLKHLLLLRPRNLYEIIVVDGDKNKTTLNKINLKTVRKISSRKGRANQMNMGAANAKGSILIFLHADTILPLSALKKIEQRMRDKATKAGAFDLGFSSSKFSMKIIATIASWRSRLTRLPYGDQAMFIQKTYFEALKGFKTMPLMEDVEIMQRIKKNGDRISIINEKVLTSPRKWEEQGLIFCTLRNWALTIMYFIGIPPKKLVKFY